MDEPIYPLEALEIAYKEQHQALGHSKSTIYRYGAAFRIFHRSSPGHAH